MGRILFLSIAAFLAYKYIGRSNRKSQSEIPQGSGVTEVLPPVPGEHAIIVGGVREPQLTSGRSAAVEPDPLG